ncbi:DUF4229 domain-containing protein [Corynebacterium lizhenjunii]|uniref:DUF4229 domain-containing protein n=1 Tax=Corynebacterium lizhenjunii TaxID=2709394 RepID=UPI0013EA459B|nr:DUF4229 domain-containing protein [Corynebacterium lizhenjunii]
MTTPAQTPQPPAPDPALRAKARRAMIKYGAARLVLFLVLTAVIHAIVLVVGAPVMLLASALMALFVALPLSMLLFTSWRVEATESLALYSQQRKAHKQWVQAELAGR